VIHYHGTPIGGKRDEAMRFLKGRDALISFFRPDDIALAAEVCRTFVLDNGAFSAWKSGNAVRDWNPYYEFLNRWSRNPRFSWALIPDVINGSEQENDDLLAEWPFETFGVPVWHLHESLQRLERLVLTWPIVAFGSSGNFSVPGTEAWFERMNYAMQVACDENGYRRASFHGLRMLDTNIFTQFPFSSADSTNVAVNGQRKAKQVGCSTYLGQLILAERIESFQSADRWKHRSVQQKMFSESD